MLSVMITIFIKFLYILVLYLHMYIVLLSGN